MKSLFLPSPGRLVALFILSLPFAWTPAQAVNLTIQVKTPGQAPIENVVAYLTSTKTGGLPVRGSNTQIQQINKTFVPLVSVVQTGSQIDFPNRDKFRHHVYSFSPVKKFEIKLYADTPAKPILFNKSGYVVMGCNIHDNMISHLLIVDTPYFAKTDVLGVARIMDVPAGDYALVIWHYQQPDRELQTISLSLKADSTQNVVLPQSFAN